MGLCHRQWQDLNMDVDPFLVNQQFIKGKQRGIIYPPSLVCSATNYSFFDSFRRKNRENMMRIDVFWKIK